MNQLRALLARIAGLFGGGHSDADVNDELATHLELATNENIRRGMTPDEARRQARLAAGGITQAAEAVRDRRGLPVVTNLIADVRYAVRTLRRTPGFTLVVVVTLALGIGANTAIFSVIQGVLLKPLPYRDGAHLVYLRQSSDGPSADNEEFSVPEINDLTAGVPAFGGVAQYSPFNLTLQEGDKAVKLTVGLVTGNFFNVMGLKPVIGRVTLPSDDGTGVPPVIVLTHDFWMNRFGGDSTIVGKDLQLDGNSVRVIGVLQPAPYFPDQVDALLNMVISPHHVSAQMIQGRTHRMTEVFARLAPTVTLQQARNEVAATYARMRHDHPDAYDAGSHFRIAVTPLKTAIGERAQQTLWLLMAAAAFVLIIAAANVANLTLMRGVRREHELVTRAALGAGIPRLRRLLLVENLVLTLVGGVVGVGLAVFGVRLLTTLAARYSPRAQEIRLDGTVLGFALALSVALALLLSFVAVLPPEGALAGWLAAGGRRASGGVRKQRLQRGLVVAQVAVSVMLMAGAGLLTRTILRLSEMDTGLKTESMLTMEVQLLSTTSGDYAKMAAADVAAKNGYAEMARQVRALPGVLDVGLGSTMPLRTSFALDVKAEGRSLAPGEAQPRADIRTADPDYFAAAGIPVLAGRPFAATDQRGSGLVVVINKTLADMMFPGVDPIGRHIAWTGDVLRFTPFSGDWRTVVGVVANTKDGGPDAGPRGVMFEPFAQELALGGGLVIRSDYNPGGLTNSALRIARGIAPGIPVEHVETLTQYRDETVAPQRLNAELVSAFSVLAVLIAAVGIAGVLAFSVSARTGEIGIRMSLGADGGTVQRMILGEGGTVLTIGLFIGVAGAFLATGVIRGLLFGVPPHDPVTFVSVTALMALIGLVACWIPALRAARIDPVIAMRGQ